MLKNKHKYIYINTITREFIKFAKIMGIFSEVEYSFKTYLQYSPTFYCCTPLVPFWKFGSFAEYALEQSRYYSLLNDGLIMDVYLFSYYPVSEKLSKNKKELTDLFLSCLKDKGYSRYIKLIR